LLVAGFRFGMLHLTCPAQGWTRQELTKKNNSRLRRDWDRFTLAAMPFGLIALVAFWVAAIKLWVADGPKIPLIFIGLWVVGLFGFPLLHWPGIVFLVFECVLGIILLLVDRYKASL